MDVTDTVRSLDGAELEQFGRKLFEGDEHTKNAVIAELARSGDMRDCEKIAVIIASADFGAGDGGGDYYTARFGKLFEKRYIDIFTAACIAAGCPESEYIRVLIAAGSAKPGSALYKWNEAVDVYLSTLAASDFDRAADYLDMYDIRFKKYGALIRLDPERALDRLVNKVIFGKNVDKTALRCLLMEYPEVSEYLMELYSRSDAHTRVAIVRLLRAYKSDPRVAEFLADTVAADKSKSVRDVIKPRKPSGGKVGKITDAVAFFENVMSDGSTYTRAQWLKICKDPDCAAVADRIFFCVRKPSGADVYMYNDGEFFDIDDKPAQLPPSARLGVLHVLDLPPTSELLTLGILQPFEQLRRPVFSPVRGDRYASDRISGTMIAADRFDRNAKRYLFKKTDKHTPSEPDVYIRRVGEYVVAVTCDRSDITNSVTCSGLGYYAANGPVTLGKRVYISAAQPLAAPSVPKREFSEMTYYARQLFEE